jgi:hypothetical protein
VIPIGPLVWAAIAASRAARGEQAAPQENGPFGLGHVLLWCFGILTVVLPHEYVAAHPLLWSIYLTWIVLVAALLFPWWTSRLVLIPLGLPKSSYQLNRIATVVWDGDTASGPAVAALLAMLHGGKKDTVFLEKIEQDLYGQTRVRGATVLGYALLAAVRGELETARTLASSVRTMPSKVTPWPVPSLANEWLMIEAASRGDWAAVHDRGRRARRRSWMSLFLFGVSCRLLGEPDRWAALRLPLTWLLAGRWRRTWPLLKRGLNEQPKRNQPPLFEAKIDERDLLRAALELHVAALRTPPKRLIAQQVRMLGRVWDAALDGESLRQRFTSRATALAVVPSSAHLLAARETVIADLVVLLREAGIPLAHWQDESELLQDVAVRLREELIERVETASRALHRRAQEKRALREIDEWREWLALRDLYQDAGRVGGLELRRVAFSQVHHDVCNYAVWLFNVRDEKPMANAMFIWLLAEAKEVQDASAIELQEGNVRAGCGY